MKLGNFYEKGVIRTAEGLQFTFQIEKESKIVEIRLYANQKEVQKFEIPDDFRMGQIYSVLIEDASPVADSYCYYADGEFVEDAYARRVIGLKKYGVMKACIGYALPKEEYCWENDAKPHHTYAESVIYGLHVRGFTKHVSSGVKKKGTFAGVCEKLPYLKQLGITAIELMPAYEFDEVILPLTMYQKEDDFKINYWGYQKGYYYAPKSAYAYTENACAEMKDMIKAFHKEGIEVFMQFYFPKAVPQREITDILYFWVKEYHVDGFHLLGENLLTEVYASDPLLKETKLTADYFPESEAGSNCAYWKRDFLYDMRRVLKGDEGSMSALVSHIQDNPEKTGVINRIAGYDGFTLYDLVSYDKKHNEANGENNRDGNDYNFSWNCGAEGKTRKRTIIQLRKRQMKNAFALVLLSQGTPYIQSGDEFGQTQEGNNNPYCQDNETTWLDWRLLKTNKELCDFVKTLIQLRTEHGVFRREERLKGLDYLGCGSPDISFHGEAAWKPNFAYDSRCMGVLYSGKYVKEESDFYVAYNMYWKPRRFALPKLSKDYQWEPVLDTYVSGNTADEAEQALEKSRDIIVVQPRSVVVYRSVKNKK